jgi:hypothetical protein
MGLKAYLYDGYFASMRRQMNAAVLQGMLLWC